MGLLDGIDGNCNLGSMDALKDPPNPEDEELQSQVAETQNMLREAKERQARLEQLVDEAMSQSQRT